MPHEPSAPGLGVAAGTWHWLKLILPTNHFANNFMSKASAMA